MKQRHIDMTLFGLLVLSALSSVVYSAIGTEQASVFTVLLSAAVIVVGAILLGYRRHMRRSAAPVFGVSISALAVIISVAAGQWPLRVTYALSRGALDELAARVRRSERVATPVRAGLFNIRQAEISSRGIICLWTQPHSGGSTGLMSSG